MKYGILYADQNGDSHFKDGEVGFELVNFAPPAPPVGLTSYMPASQLVFFKIPSGWYGDWHPAPKRQFFCVFLMSLNSLPVTVKHAFTVQVKFSFLRIPGVKVTKAGLLTKRIL